jgi:hypothetical protein
MVGEAGAVLRIRDRQRAAIENPVAKPVAYTEENEPWDIRAARLRREGETRRAHEAEQQAAWERARARDKTDSEARAIEASRIIVQNMSKTEIKQILQDATAEEIQEVIRRIDASHSRGVPFMYKIYLDQVRAEKK